MNNEAAAKWHSASLPNSHARPNFFIIGQPKSGTTALYHMLKQHPTVHLGRVKEPDYFCRDLWPAKASGETAPRSDMEYVALFPNSDKKPIIGDTSPVYLFSTVAAERIRQFEPSAKILAILREPVDYIHSSYLQRRRNRGGGCENARSLKKALALESERKRGRRLPSECGAPQLLYYSERVKYREQLERYYAHFPAEQVLVLIYDDFQADNAGTLRRVCRFLGVDETFEFALGEHNKGARLRSKRVQEAIHGLSHGRGAWSPVKRAAKAVVPAQTTRRAVGWAYQRLAFSPKGEVDPKLRRELMRRFKPEVEAVSDLLGRDLVGLWGYDRV